MGRKKSKRAAPKKAFKAKLEKSFSCPFCNHESSIECKLDRQRQIGTLTCRICSAGYQTVINYLSEPIDVFGEWIDAIEAQEQKRKANKEVSEDEQDDGHVDTRVAVKKGKATKSQDDSDEDEIVEEDDLVDYKEMAERKKQKQAKKKSKTKFDSDEESEGESVGFECDSEPEADFTEEDDD